MLYCCLFYYISLIFLKVAKMASTAGYILKKIEKHKFYLININKTVGVVYKCIRKKLSFY